MNAPRKQHSAQSAAEASTADDTDRRAVWKEKQLKHLNKVFHDEINAGDIAFQSVKTKKLKKCNLLRNYTDRQVFDKLCNEVNKTAEQGTAVLPMQNESQCDHEQRPVETDESDITPPSTNR